MGHLQLAPSSLFADRFEIIQAAGSGGMGTVYRARDKRSGELVALKLLHASSGSGERERFAREAQILSELRHPGIVSHLEHGQSAAGQHFLVMEWLDGLDLGHRLLRGPLSLADCRVLLTQVADALAAAHARGIIHRDIKPTNLFLCGGDIARVKILDFGIARRMSAAPAMTRTGVVIGTPEYMAPEQARGHRDLTPRVDLFSLGCVLYEGLSGQPPFVADHIAAVLVRILFEEPVAIEERRSGVPAPLSAILSRLLQKEPERRLPDALTLKRELLGLGELSEPVLSIKAVSPRPRALSFAEEEQRLLSIVLAAPPESTRESASEPEEEMATDVARTQSLVLLNQVDRQALFEAVRALGATADFLANGAMLVTVSAASSAQEQAMRAARAALLIKERWPQAQVALATGRGSIRGRNAVGEVVELAARLLLTGGPSVGAGVTNGVLLDRLSAKLLEGRFSVTLETGGTQLLSEARDTDASRPLLGKPTPCVGREGELGNLEVLLKSCIEESEARVVLVTAPPGQGKSRLRHEFLRRLERHSEPLVRLLGRADLGAAGAPYGILRGAFRQLCGISGSEPLAEQQERLRTRLGARLANAGKDRVVLFLGELCGVPFSDDGWPILQAARQQPKIMADRVRRAFLDWLAAECAAAPVLVVLDDLQWSDELTFTILDQALHEQAAAPLFVLSFARPEVHDSFPKLWATHRLQKISLARLSKRACERLIQQVLGDKTPPELVARAIEQSAGNALFLEELIRAIAEGQAGDQPETVVAMLQTRISRLDSGARRAVRAAAIFGQTFWRGGVAALLEVASSAAEVEAGLAALLDAELTQLHKDSRLMKEEEHGFRHALVRDAAYALLTPEDRATGHRLAGEFLAHSSGADAVIIAEHFERGGDLPRAASHFWRAAERSFEQCDYRGALRHVERGARCSPDAALQAQLSSVKSAIDFRSGRFSEAHATRAIAAMRVLRPGSVAWSRATVAAIATLMILQKPRQAVELFAQALTTEPEAEGRAAYIDSMSYLANWAATGAPLDVVQALFARLQTVVAAARAELPSTPHYLHGSTAQVALYRQGRPFTAIVEGKTSQRLAHELGDTMAEFHMSCHIVELGWLELGDRDGVVRRLRELQPQVFATQEAGPGMLWRQLFARALCAGSDAGAWDEAIALTEPLLKIQNLAFFAQAIRARVALQRGQLQIAEPLIREAMPAFRMLPYYLADLAVTFLRVLTALGRHAEAAEAAESAFAALGPGSVGPYEVELRLAASLAWHAAGDIERAPGELRRTLQAMKVRLDDIADPHWKTEYLTRNPHCVTAQALAQKWAVHQPLDAD